MTSIDRHISELLFDHDCVILPGFGGFLTNYSGARIHPIKHSFQPPARTVVFNANLTTNEGLLADYISRNGKISYQEASTLIRHYAEACIRDMDEGKTVYFRNIGSCKMGREKNIIFEPDATANFLEDAFGLPSFVSPIIKRETVRKRLEESMTPRPTAPDQRKRRRLTPAMGWAATIAIPVIGLGLLYFFSPQVFNGQHTSYSSMMPFVKFSGGEVAKSPGTFDRTAEYVDFRVIPEKEAEEVIIPETIAEPEPEVIPERILRKYQIVVGAFSSETNASKYVQKLQQKNYDASIVGTSRNGLFRVSINGLDDKMEATEMLARIRSEENPSAWLLRIK